MKAVLELTVRRQGAHSVLEDCYHTQPFKIMNVAGGSEELQLMLMSASPGVLDGDVHQINIVVGAGASLRLDTQSYQRFFAMETGARQLLSVRLEAGARFRFLPLPSVPHAGALVQVVNEFTLDSGSRLTWGEVLTCGRKGSGERFQFSRYRCQTKIWYKGNLLMQEVLLLEPQAMRMERLGFCEGYTHQATFVCIEEEIKTSELLATLKQLIDQAGNCLGGVTALSQAGVLVRLLGQGAEQLYDLLRLLADAVSGVHHSPVDPEKTIAYAG